MATKRQFRLQRVVKDEKKGEIIITPLENRRTFSLAGAWRRKEKKYPGEHNVVVILIPAK